MVCYDVWPEHSWFLWCQLIHLHCGLLLPQQTSPEQFWSCRCLFLNGILAFSEMLQHLKGPKQFAPCFSCSLLQFQVLLSSCLCWAQTRDFRSVQIWRTLLPELAWCWISAAEFGQVLPVKIFPVFLSTLPGQYLLQFRADGLLFLCLAWPQVWIKKKKERRIKKKCCYYFGTATLICKPLFIISLSLNKSKPLQYRDV